MNPATLEALAGLTLDDFEVIDIAELHVDMTYQRHLQEHLVKDILREGYDINAAGVIIVNERPSGDRYIIDGQHRVEVAKRVGETEMFAKVLHLANGEEEASLRNKMGRRKADTPHERFKARLRAGDKQAIAINTIVEDLGGRVNLVPNTDKGINGISALETIFKVDDGESLRVVLATIKAAWGSLDGKAAGVNTIKAIHWLLDKHAMTVDRKRLVKKLHEAPIDALDMRAKTIQPGAGGALWKNYYRAMVDKYNERLLQSKRLRYVEH